MDHAAVAKKIRQAIFHRAEEDGRVMHGDSVEAEIVKVLDAEDPPKPSFGYGLMLAGQPVDATEWR